LKAGNHWHFRWMCIGLPKLLNDAVDECSLGQGNGIAIMLKCNPKCELGGAEVRDIPF